MLNYEKHEAKFKKRLKQDNKITEEKIEKVNAKRTNAMTFVRAQVKNGQDDSMKEYRK